MADLYAGAGARAGGIGASGDVDVTATVSALAVVGILAGIFILLTLTQPADRQTAMRGMGDDQAMPGVGFNTIMTGLLVPEDYTKWHYGPAGNIPSNWQRHRGTYPRRAFETMERIQVTPLNSPAFPRCDYKWYYTPPQDEDSF